MSNVCFRLPLFCEVFHATWILLRIVRQMWVLRYVREVFLKCVAYWLEYVRTYLLTSVIIQWLSTVAAARWVLQRHSGIFTSHLNVDWLSKTLVRWLRFFLTQMPSISVKLERLHAHGRSSCLIVVDFAGCVNVLRRHPTTEAQLFALSIGHRVDTYRLILITSPSTRPPPPPGATTHSFSFLLRRMTMPHTYCRHAGDW